MGRKKGSGDVYKNVKSVQRDYNLYNKIAKESGDCETPNQYVVEARWQGVTRHDSKLLTEWLKSKGKEATVCK